MQLSLDGYLLLTEMYSICLRVEFCMSCALFVGCKDDDIGSCNICDLLVTHACVFPGVQLFPGYTGVRVHPANLHCHFPYGNEQLYV